MSRKYSIEKRSPSSYHIPDIELLRIEAHLVANGYIKEETPPANLRQRYVLDRGAKDRSVYVSFYHTGSVVVQQRIKSPDYAALIAYIDTPVQDIIKVVRRGTHES